MVVTRSSTLTLGGGLPIGYKGVINCSANPNYPAAVGGDMYIVSVAGKIGGASGPNVVAGDAIIAKTVTAAGDHATVGANWDIIETNVDFSNVTITGGTINGTTVGATTPAAITGTTLSSTGDVSIGDGTTEKIDWNSGNVTYVPIGGNIETYAAAATAGDTLILAAGTYTVTDDIDITQAVNIVGQGVGQTTVTCATNGINMFDITADNVRIANLSITHSGAGGTNHGIRFNAVGGTIFSGCRVWNVAITMSGAATNNWGIAYLDAGGEIRNVTITISNSTNSYGLYMVNAATAEANTTLNVYELKSTVSGATTSAAIYDSDNSSSSDSIMNLYNSTGISTTSTTSYGLWSQAGDALAYAENCVFNGSLCDVAVTSTGFAQIRNCTLVNGTTTGTITYDGYQTFEDLGSGTRNSDVTVDGSGLNSILANKSWAGALYFDGVTANTRIYHTMNQNIGTSDFTIFERIAVPTSSPSASIGIMGLSSSTTTTVANYGLETLITSGGSLYVRLYGATTSDATIAYVQNFVSNYGGKIVDVAFVRNATTPSMSIYVNGILQTNVDSTSGTPPTWAGSVTSTNAIIGTASTTQIYNDRIYLATLFNRALTQAEVRTLRERGISFADQWGLMTPIISSSTPTLNGGFETAGGGGADVFANWSETTAGTSAISQDSVDFQSGANSCKFVQDASNSQCYVSQAVLTVGKKYRAVFWAKVSSIANSPIFSTGSTTGSTSVPFTSTSWTQYIVEFTAGSTSFYFGRSTNCDSLTLNFDSLELYEIGAMCVPDIENADPSKTTIVRDRSSNKFTGTVTATGVTQVKPMIQLNPSEIVMDAGTGTAGASGTSVGWFNQVARTYTDNATAASGTAASFGFNNYQQPTLAATNASVTTTDAATVYIANAPANGTNMTLTRAWAQWIDAGNVRFDGNIAIGISATTYPATNLHITTATNGGGMRIEGVSGSYSPAITQFLGTTQYLTTTVAGTADGGLVGAVIGDSIIKNAANYGMLFGINNTESFRIAATTGDLTFIGGKNIALSTSTGTKIGTATNQLLGFYNATPVDQPATVSDPSGGATQDAEARTAISAIIDRLQELGLIA